MKKGWKVVLAILCALVIAGASFVGAVVFLNDRYAAVLSKDGDSAVQAKTAEVERMISRYFIDDYDEQALADGAASGMVAATMFSALLAHSSCTAPLPVSM